MKFIKTPKNQFLFFILCFFLVNLAQSAFTELLDDEAYYWVWSKQLAFGYFDHPPLVALWIKIGNLFFEGELGLRFFSTLSFSLALYLIFLCIEDKRKWQYVPLFFLLIISTALLNIYGFITVPDTPLLLFTALFLYIYKLFLEKNSLLLALLLGISMAGMLYSKYHGILVIFFILLSNLRLLRNKYFWIASLFGAGLFLPHILWQLEQDFPSIRYHLFERSKKPYKFEYTLMHFVNLIAIIGLTFPVIYYAFFKQKAQSLFQKGLQFMVYGTIVFFFLSSFKTSTQAQWNGPLLIPLVLLTFSYFIDHLKARKWLLYLGLANLLVMIIARILLANAELSPVLLETHNANSWAQDLKEKTGGRPLVFKSSYKRASKYRFYTGIKTHSYSSLRTRQSQYDLYDFEKAMQGEQLTVVGDSIQGYPLFNVGKHQYLGDDIEDYRSYQKLQCTITEPSLSFAQGEEGKIKFEIYNSYPLEVPLKNVKFAGVFQGKKNRILKKVPLSLSQNLTLQPGETKLLEAFFEMPDLPDTGPVTFRVALKFYQLPTGFQGNKIRIIKK